MRIATALVFALCALLSFYLAYADFLFQSGSPKNMETAVRMVPLNADYQAATGNFERSLQLNPYNTALRIERALEAEARGDVASAEAQLLEATRYDQRFALRWTLANFYFRHDREPEFWKWFRLAAERSYDDRRALFQLAWRRTQDAARVEAALPGDPSLQRAYLRFLLDENRLDASQAVATAHVVPTATPDDLALLLDAAEKQLAAGRLSDALALWNGMIERDLLGGRQPLDPSRGVFLSDPGLQNEPNGLAFDWRLLWRSGVASYWRQGEFHIGLDGRQASPTELLEIAIPLDPETRAYQLQFRYRSEGIRSGLRWRAATATVSPHRIGADPEWTAASIRIDCPEKTDRIRLTLVYERESGTVRQEGTLRLRQFALESLAKSGSRPTTSRSRQPGASTASADPTPRSGREAKAGAANRIR